MSQVSGTMFTVHPSFAGQNEVYRIFFEGEPIEARRGVNVAAALLAAGISDFRSTPVDRASRGPYCLMGICFDCLVVIDGQPNKQSCMTMVEPDMRIERQVEVTDGA
jgi:hypothetical protein